MARRANPAPLNVHVSFRATRTSAQSLIDIYERLTPSKRRPLVRASEVNRVADEVRAMPRSGGKHG